MAPIHSRKIEDLIVDLGAKVAALQSARAQGPILASYTSTTLPANPPTGLEVLVTDLGLRAYWNGYESAIMQFNGVTSLAYNWNTYYSRQGSGTVAATGPNAVSGMQCGEFWNNHFGSSGRGFVDAVVPNYSRTSGTKGMMSRSAASDAGVAGITQTYSGMSNITAAVTSLTIAISAGAFTTGIFTLRGL
jgi:hypothetical protein